MLPSQTNKSNLHQVNFFRHTAIFFHLAKSNVSLQTSHVALYWSLMNSWNKAFFAIPFTLHRDDMMLPSCFSSKATFYRTIHGLEKMDLIRFYPARSKYKSSHCCMSVLEFQDGETRIQVWGLEGQMSITETPDKLPDSYTTVHPLDGSPVPVILKTLTFGKKNPSLAVSHEPQPPYDPLNDPSIFTPAVMAIFNEPKSHNHDKHNPPKQGRSSLRPPGIQPDPNADYSVPL